MPRKTALLGLVVFVSMSARSSAARADNNKAACADAYGKAQTLRDAQKLVDARAQLRICARPVCTQFIAKDCGAWLGEIESRVPSVVPFAKDAAGAEIGVASVSIDGTVATEHLDGHAIDVDPGRHAFVFTLPNGQKLEQSYVVLEGQKAQRVGVTMAPQAPAQGGAKGADQPVPAATEPEGGSSSWNGLKTLAVTAGAVGLAGIGVGAYFGVSAMQSASDQQKQCPSSASTCADPNWSKANQDHTDASRSSTLSTISLAAGGALVGAGVVLFLFAPKGPTNEHPTEKTQSSLQVVPALGPGGGGLWLGGKF